MAAGSGTIPEVPMLFFSPYGTRVGPIRVNASWLWAKGITDLLYKLDPCIGGLWSRPALRGCAALLARKAAS